MQIAFTIVFTLLSTVLLSLISGKILHMLQLSGYKCHGVMNWIRLTKGDYLLRYFGAGFFSVAAMLVYIACFGEYPAARYFGYLFMVGFCILFFALNLHERQKVPLKNTARIIRLRLILAIFYAIESFLLMWLGSLCFAGYSLLGILPALVPYNALLVNFLMKPVEKLNNHGYKVKAMRKLDDHPGLIRVGITGSYGKTTEKAILSAVLSVKFKVCASKLSYNTPMGIAKVVNNDLTDSDNIFIAEMGARNVGDIKELAQIKKEYSRIKSALDEVESTGYGIVMPTIDELSLEEPEIVKQGGRYGVRLCASAPSIHMMKADIKTEVAPVVGSESQSEELVKYLLEGFEEDPQKIWESNIFGKSLNELVNEGLRNKLYHMPADARMKFQETLERVINEGCTGLLCILL